MAKLGKLSLERLATCHPDLVRLVMAYEAESPWDITVLCGYRDEIAQHTAFVTGMSKLDYPESKHNSRPSRAVDLAPYPVDWSLKTGKWERQRVLVTQIARRLSIPIRIIQWDWPHFELA